MIVYLHIGTPKSGTSYLQDICSLNRERLAADGILWPGREWGDQVRAVRDVLNLHPGGEVTDDAAGAWGRFVAEVDAWDGRAVVLSMEWLVHATPAHVGFIVGSLREHEVRVIVTARDLARNVPSQWQEQMQNWATWTWEEYLAAVTCEAPLERDAGRQFYLDHDLGRILRTWAEVVPLDRISFITVPGRGAPHDLLWKRFAEVISVDAGAFDTDVPDNNSSLGAASAELMRRLNVATHACGLSWRVGDPLLKWALAKGVLSDRRRQEARLVLPAEHQDWAVRESRRLIEEVEAVGVRVLGSLEELLPSAAEETGPVVVTPDQMLEAAVDGIAGLAMLVEAATAAGSMGTEVLEVGVYVTEVERRRALKPAVPPSADPVVAHAVPVGPGTVVPLSEAAVPVPRVPVLAPSRDQPEAEGEPLVGVPARSGPGQWGDPASRERRWTSRARMAASRLRARDGAANSDLTDVVG